MSGPPPGRLLFHHIASRSPWRRGASARSLALPRLPELVSLAHAREATNRALDQPIDDGVVISS